MVVVSDFVGLLKLSRQLGLLKFEMRTLGFLFSEENMRNYHESLRKL